jgi:hypothetical protein
MICRARVETIALLVLSCIRLRLRVTVESHARGQIHSFTMQPWIACLVLIDLQLARNRMYAIEFCVSDMHW